MRWLLLALLCGCATKSPPQPATATTAMDAVQTRACESCRHNLELCHRDAHAGPYGSLSTDPECMDRFMACLKTQGLDSTPCAGLN